MEIVACSVGDNIGLFPVVYADRLRLSLQSSGFSAEEDEYLLSEVVEKGGQGLDRDRVLIWY